MTITIPTSLPCEDVEAEPLTPPVHAEVDTDGEECVSCGTSERLAYSPDAFAGIGGFWCDNPTCQDHRLGCDLVAAAEMAAETTLEFDR